MIWHELFCLRDRDMRCSNQPKRCSLMTIEELINNLENLSITHSVRKVLENTLDNFSKDELIPHLLEILRKVNRAHETVSDDYSGHIIAMHLLAMFGEERAFPLLLEMISLDDDKLDDLIGDFLTESMPQILADTCGQDMRLLIAGAENTALGEWSRHAFLSAIKFLYLAGHVSSVELARYLRSAFRENRFQDNEIIYSEAAIIVVDLGLKELEEEVRHAFKMEQIDPSWVSEHELNIMLKSSKTPTMAEIIKSGRLKLIDRSYILSLAKYLGKEQNNFEISKNDFIDHTPRDNNKLLKEKAKKKRKATKAQRRKNR